MNRYEGIVSIPEPLRADRYVSEVLGILGRSRLKSLGARFIVGGREVKPSRPLKAGELLVVEWEDEGPQDFAAEDIPLDVLYEDDSVIVVDKPQGMVTHPAHGNWTGTLANALLGRLRSGGAEGDGDRARSRSAASWSSGGAEGPSRAGIVHRLDKDTSGVIICAKTAAAQDFLASQFRERSVAKEYLAIVRGRPPAPEGRIANRLARDPRDRKRFAVVTQDGKGEAGKLAVTSWRTIAAFGGYAFLSLRPKTGRTHQLRVHMKHLGCPILGDPVYSRRDERFPGATLMLHAWRLRIALPGSGIPAIFRAGLPGRFRTILAALNGSPGGVR
ncbi:MAG: RluA family pseudouridine synthase [Spirochaetes bacterium]|nr:RluA family pseudouridine synthase [Spirochaetota bacterium]